MSPTLWSRGAGLAVAATLTGLAVGVQPPMTATAQFNDTAVVVGNTMTTRSACSTGPSYAAAVLAANPSFYWRLGEQAPPAVTSVQDSTANDLDATVQDVGLTFGPTSAGLIECDDTYSLDLPGTPTSSQFLVQPTAVPNPDTFTISAWVQTTSDQGGWVLGMGSARWGTSVNRDRVLYLRPDGRPAFTVGLAPRTTVQGATPVNDDVPHLLVATVGPSGTVLYVDGVEVDSDPTLTSGAVYTGNEPTDPPPPAVPPTPDGHGYWRVGYDATTGFGPGAPTRDQLSGRVDEVAVWQNRALTASDVAELYAQNHW